MPRKLKCECGTCHTCYSRARARKSAAERKARIDGAAGEIARLRAALTAISNRCYAWTMREPLEIVTHGGVLHAAPIPEIKQTADAALSGEVA
jgi:hypothetical protein